MIDQESAKGIIYWTTGIYVIPEGDRSYQQRLKKAEDPHLRRCFITKQAADDYMGSRETDKPKRSETAQFSRDSLKNLLSFRLPRRRWIGISGYRIIPLST